MSYRRKLKKLNIVLPLGSGYLNRQSATFFAETIKHDRNKLQRNIIRKNEVPEMIEQE